MTERSLPVGPAVDFTPCALPPLEVVHGRTCRLEPLDPNRHTADLHAAHAADPEGRQWTYLMSGPFADEAALRVWVEQQAVHPERITFAVVDTATGRALGSLAYLRLRPEFGTIELGNVAFAPPLQRTTSATEAVFLMARAVFDLGYRRFEWKCDGHNAASRRAAERFGFRYEGTFRQDFVYKGRNRDTAWFSITDAEWPRLCAAFEGWLAPDNFGAAGAQRRRLQDFR